VKILWYNISMKCKVCGYKTKNKHSFANHVRYGCPFEKWTKKELELFKEKYSNTFNPELSKLLDKDIPRIKRMAKGLGLRKSKGFLSKNNVSKRKEVRKKISNNKKGGIPYNKGKKSPETTGEKNGNWKGGITEESLKARTTREYYLWREAVFARDNWTCQDCGKKCGKDIIAHHIKLFSEYPELRTSIENGVTLCRECHKLRHKRRK
jgi:hypothetical protein